MRRARSGAPGRGVVWSAGVLGISSCLILKPGQGATEGFLLFLFWVSLDPFGRPLDEVFARLLATADWLTFLAPGAEFRLSDCNACVIMKSPKRQDVERLGYSCRGTRTLRRRIQTKT